MAISTELRGWIQEVAEELRREYYGARGVPVSGQIRFATNGATGLGSAGWFGGASKPIAWMNGCPPHVSPLEWLHRLTREFAVIFYRASLVSFICSMPRNRKCQTRFSVEMEAGCMTTLLLASGRPCWWVT